MWLWVYVRVCRRVFKLNISGENRAVRLLANRWQIIKMRGNDMERPKHQVVIYIYIYIHKFVCDQRS